MSILASVFFFLALDIDIKAKSCLDFYREMTGVVISLENALPGEASLRAQGLGDNFVANLDAVDAFIREAPTLRNGPEGAPSRFLADRLEDQINFVARGLESRGKKNPLVLDEFNIRGYSRWGLSHRNWVRLNDRLARESTPGERGRESLSYVETISYEFPGHIMAFVPGDLGVIPFNRSFLTEVIPLSLQNDRRWAHRRYVWPLSYQVHDAKHFFGTEKVLESLDTLELEALARFHRHFLLSTGALTGKERQLVELVYFILWHEPPWVDIKNFAVILNKHPGEFEMAKELISDIIDRGEIWDWIEKNPQSVHMVYGDIVNRMARLIVESGE